MKKDRKSTFLIKNNLFPYRSKLKDEISTQQVELPSSTLQFTVEDLEPSIYYQFWVVSNSVSNMGNASIIQGYRVATSRSQVNEDNIGNAILLTFGYICTYRVTYMRKHIFELSVRTGLKPVKRKFSY